MDILIYADIPMNFTNHTDAIENFIAAKDSPSSDTDRITSKKCGCTWKFFGSVGFNQFKWHKLNIFGHISRSLHI